MIHLVLGMIFLTGYISTSYSSNVNDICGSTSSRKEHEFQCGDCRCRGKLAICHGGNTNQPPEGIPAHITALTLEGYDLQKLDQNFIPGHLRLNNLNFTNCDISDFDEHAFDNLIHLSKLVFKQCRINNQTTMVRAVSRIPGDRHLDLGFLCSKIENATVRVWSQLSNDTKFNDRIQIIDLNGNLLTSFNVSFFSQFTSLRSLNLSGNQINQFDIGDGQMENLKVLDLSNNRLIPHVNNTWGLCPYDNNTSLSPRLEELYLVHNVFDHFPRSRLACLKSVKYLDISHNMLKVLNFTDVGYLSSLEHLVVNSNWLIDIAGHVPVTLKTLSLNNNQFAKLPPYLCPKNSSKTFANLTSVSLKWNLLDRIFLEKWDCLTGLRRLYFASNRITAINNDALWQFKHLVFLDLQHNSLSDLNPNALNSSSLKVVILESNPFLFYSNKSHRMFENAANVTRLVMSNVRLGRVEGAIATIFSPLEQLSHLYLKAVGLTTFPTALISNLKRLKVLNVDGNRLTNISFPSNFSIELTLQTLSLAENNINRFTAESFPDNLRQSLKCLNFQRNPLSCDCDAEWFRDQVDDDGYVGHTKLIGWPTGYVCHSPIKREYLEFKQFKLPYLECYRLGWGTIAGITAGSSLLIFTIIASIMYSKRWYIQYWLHYMKKRLKGVRSLNEETRLLEEPDIRFDGYVVYNDENTHFVEHALRERLENQLGYKLFLWNRDAGAGGATVDEILDGMDASRSVIVVLSTNLMSDKWAKFQVDVALGKTFERKSPVFLVRLQDLSLANASKYWCVLIAKTSGGTWCDNDNDIRRRVFDQELEKHLGLPLSRQASNNYGINSDQTYTHVNHGSQEETLTIRRNSLI